MFAWYTGGIWTQVGTLTQQLQVEAAMVVVIWRRDTAAAPPSPEIRPLYFYLRTCTFLLPSVDRCYLPVCHVLQSLRYTCTHHTPLFYFYVYMYNRMNRRHCSTCSSNTVIVCVPHTVLHVCSTTRSARTCTTHTCRCATCVFKVLMTRTIPIPTYKQIITV